jgi:multimeric flavodoxin WrbA
MTHRILVVYGSPRKDGNSSTLAEAFIEGAESGGAEIFRADAGHADINGCLGCEYCFSHDGECCQDDDMQRFYPLLHSCDLLVYATPVYSFTFTAQIKAFIDRMFCGIGKPFAIKSTVLLTVCEDKDASIMQHIVGTYRAIITYAGWKDKGTVTVSCVYKKGDIANNPKLAEARILGFNLAAEPIPADRNS